MLQETLDRYLDVYPAEKGSLDLLQEQLAAHETMNDRRNFRGHITGSAIVLSPDRSKILLIHHKAFNRWQQPGGHWENDDEANPREAAQREGEEETSVRIAEYLPIDATNPLVPLDIDSHQVHARPEKDEPDHVHHDWRYVFIAANTDLQPQVEEVNAAKWFDLDAHETEHVREIIRKLGERGITQA
jgi:8-oxo-dGTP pyrophosphatase MutT (NUDIX family)